jgi:hypothetical protein
MGILDDIHISRHGIKKGDKIRLTYDKKHLSGQQSEVKGEICSLTLKKSSRTIEWVDIREKPKKWTNLIITLRLKNNKIQSYEDFLNIEKIKKL